MLTLSRKLDECKALPGGHVLQQPLLPHQGTAVQVDPIKLVLKEPGTVRLKLCHGKLLSSFAFESNLRRYTKAVSIWTSTGDLDHIWIVGAYFHFAGGFVAGPSLNAFPSSIDIPFSVFRGICLMV